MKNILEKNIEKKVCDYAKKNGVLQFKFTSPGRRGVPDRIFMINGKVFFIEFKATGETPSIEQLAVHRIITHHGIKVYTVDNVDTGIAAIYKEVFE